MTGRAVTLAVMALFLGFGWLLFLSQSRPMPIPRGANAFYYGNLIQGERFGVKIGDRVAAATAALRKFGLTYEPVSMGCEYKVQRLEGCTPSERYELYFIDEFIWHGEVFLGVKNGRVTSIVWSAELLPYIDL